MLLIVLKALKASTIFQNSTTDFYDSVVNNLTLLPLPPQKEVWGGTGSGQSGGRRVLGTNITSKMFSKRHCCFVLVPILIILYTFSFTRHKSFEF